MKYKKVLMLGWEFPPLFNGGLGVACHGIALVLKDKVDLSLILPKVEDSYFEDIELIGLNTLAKKELAQEVKLEYYHFLEQVDTIYHNVSAYETVEEAILEEKNIRIKKTITKKEEGKTYDILGNESLYGGDLIEKVKKYASYVLEIAQDKEFDVIYAHDWLTFLAGIYLKYFFKKPLVIHIHSLEYDRTKRTEGWVFDLEKKAIQEADTVITVSNYTKEIVQQYYQGEESKISVIHNGIQAVEKIPFGKRPFPEKLVVFLGRVTAQKGPLYFLEVAHKIAQEYPNVRFVMAGAGDEMKKVIETGAHKGLGNRFHLTGHLTKEKVNYLLSLADVYCMPSVSEPFGLSALEAAFMEVPVVISKQSGVAEVLQSALKADYWDTNKMVHHITALLTNKNLVAQQTEKALKEVQGRTWEYVGEQIIEVL